MLRTSLSIGSQADAVAFELTVSNDGEEPASLSFRDSERVRFTVEPAGGGDPVWRSDEGQMFAQMLGQERIPPGHSVSFGEIWDNPSSGEFHVVGEVACTDHDLKTERDFSV